MHEVQNVLVGAVQAIAKVQYGYVEQAVAEAKAALATKELPKPEAVKATGEKTAAVAKEVVDLAVGAQKRVYEVLTQRGQANVAELKAVLPDQQSFRSRWRSAGIFPGLAASFLLSSISSLPRALLPPSWGHRPRLGLEPFARGLFLCAVRAVAAAPEYRSGSVAHVVVVIALRLPAGGRAVALLAEIGVAAAGLGLARVVVGALPLLLQGTLALLLLLVLLLALPFTLLGDLLHRRSSDLRGLAAPRAGPGPPAARPSARGWPR